MQDDVKRLIHLYSEAQNQILQHLRQLPEYPQLQEKTDIN